MKKQYLALLIVSIIVILIVAVYSLQNYYSAKSLSYYNLPKNQTNDSIKNQDNSVNNILNTPEYNPTNSLQEQLTCSYGQIRFNDWNKCLDTPQSDGVFEAGVLIDTQQTRVSDSNINQVLDTTKSKLKELSGIDLRVQEIVRKDLSFNSDEDFAEVYLKETGKIPEGLIILGVQNSKIENNTGGYSSSYCLWDTKTDKPFTNEFHSPFLEELRYDYCFVLAFVDWSSYYHGNPSDKYGNINYYHTGQIIHEIMHFYGNNGNYDHYGTAECNRMSYISREDVSLSKSQDYMVMCPSVYSNLKSISSGQYCTAEGNGCTDNQECCNGALCCQSKGMTCQYAC